MEAPEMSLRDLPTTTTPVFVSREPVRTPISPVLTSALTQFLAMDPDCTGSLSLRFGKGFLMTSGRLAVLSEGDFAEVVDFDPVKGISLLIGTQPPADVPLHWLVYRTFPMAGAAVHVSTAPPADAASTDVPDRHPKGSFLAALDGVAALRQAGIVHADGGWITHGRDLAECLRRFSPARIRVEGS